MKTFILATMTLMTISNAYCETAAQTAKEIAAQTNITRGSIDNLLEKINKKTIDTHFNASDYLAQTQAYKNNVEASMKTFEDRLEKEILAKASYWMDQYNAILNSKDISPEQKKVLLSQRRVVITKEFEKLSVDYKKYLKEVYELIPFATTEAKVSIPVKSKVYDLGQYKGLNLNEKLEAHLLINNKKISSTFFTMSTVAVGGKDAVEVLNDNRNGYTVELKIGEDYNYEFKKNIMMNQRTVYTLYFEEIVKHRDIKRMLITSLAEKAYANNFYPTIKGSCKSAICVGLKTGDYSDLSGMIQKLLDRKIEMKLGDGFVLTLENLNLDLSLAQGILSNVNYPEELPFDI